MESDNNVDLSKVFTKFKDHFLILENTKLFFSGKYGTGKSFFLNEFFKEKEISESYYPIIISPVNYVVSSNEDIFDLIKVDIIKHLYIDGKLKIDESILPPSTLSSIKKYIIKHPLQVVQNVSACLSKIAPVAEVISKTSESVIKLIGDFEAFENKILEENKSENDQLLDYVERITTQKNSYLEYNFITQLIFKNLEKLKQNKKNVLIIEDFDRLDPAHIFRILNILSAHNSEDGTSNKFGFDKIIIVGDLDNIEHIYQHFYGIDTDFTGYIDKFYSIEPYYFNNHQSLVFHLKKILNIELSEFAFDTLVEIIEFFILQNELSIRKILKSKLLPQVPSSPFIVYTGPEDYPLPQRVRYIKSNDILFDKIELESLLILRILKNFFDSYEKLEKKLSKYKATSYQFNVSSNLNILKTIALSQHFIHNKGVTAFIFKNKHTGDFAHPEISIAGISIQIRHKWENTIPYNGEESYFKNYKLNIIRTEDGEINKKMITPNFLFDILLKHLDYFERMDYLF